MVKKRSVFDIDFEDNEPATEAGDASEGGRSGLETKSFNVQGHPLQNREPTRRGPMASAITEAADATAERTAAEESIRAENDALAHEHVRLKKLGLITDLIQTSAVGTTKLKRDRSANVDPELDELIESIRDVGLSNPIRVEQTAEGYELIQGFRRLSAFRALQAQTGDLRYSRIPAALVPRGEPLADLYRKMVDENLVRKGVSFGEMAMLALSYARDEDIEPSDAVARLYASALKQKRRYILQFTTVLAALDGAVRYPEAIPRALGIELYKYFDADVGRAGQVAKMLLAQDDRDAGDEHRLLSAAIKNDTQEKTVPVARSKTSLRLIRPEGEVRVTAQEGRIDIRLPKALSTISREALQSGVEAFLAGLNERDEG